MAPPNKGKGTNYLWLLAHATFTGNECLKWPFSTKPDGRGSIGYLGKMYGAHALMCEIINGPCPLGFECRHTCGKGHEGCVNPNHLMWGTGSDNQLDRRKHGTAVTTRWGNQTFLTDEQIREIRETIGKETNVSLAKKFGCHPETVRAWRAKTSDPHRRHKVIA